MNEFLEESTPESILKDCELFGCKTENLMKEYEIWLGGWASSDGCQKAQYLGKFESETFEQACYKAIKVNSYNINHYDDRNNTFWGCHFYDNEEEARKLFG